MSFCRNGYSSRHLHLDELLNEFPEVACYFGGLDAEVMCAAHRMIASPGIALATPEIEKARSLGIEVIGDIELFAREAKAASGCRNGFKRQNDSSDFVRPDGETSRR